MNLNKEISLSDIIQGLKNFVFCLDLYKEKINNLNVFPVPDGDTGTNMLLTMKSLDFTNGSTINIQEFLFSLKNSSLMEARGNSGVILSQFFLGLLSAYKKNKSLSLKTLAETFVNAANSTRESLPNPVEGTLMTVYDELGQKAIESYPSCDSLKDLLKILSEESIKSVKDTPNKLNILKEADVVDSGGLGFAMMINSWFYSIIYTDQEKIKESLNTAYLEMISGLSDTVSKEFFEDNQESAWGNCTVFTVTGEGINIGHQREKISKFGKSAVITGDSNLMKVHIHVLDTKPIIDYANKLGKIDNLFVQNMDEQTKNIKEDIKDYRTINTSIISICEGKGVMELFKETAGQSMHLLEGGPKNNPSINDILEVLDKIKSKNIIILPNNPNILVTVKKLIELSKKKNIYMIDTKSIQQGIASVIYFDDEKSLKNNLNKMNNIISSIEEGSVTVAIRDVVIKNKKIKKDQFLGIENDEIIDSFSDANSALKFMINKMSKRNDVLTVIVGHDSIGEQLDKLEENFQEENAEKEIMIVEGNQPYYNYLILGE